MNNPLKEISQEEKSTLELKTRWGATEKVSLNIGQYSINDGMWIGIISYEDGYPEPYADLTVNFEGKVPDYYGYVDTNNLPEAETFIKENKLGTFTGMVKQSGFCTYPLYQFDKERLKELCPSGMDMYEQEIRKKSRTSTDIDTEIDAPDAPTKIDIEMDNIYDKVIRMDCNSNLNIMGYSITHTIDDMYKINGVQNEMYFYQVIKFLNNELEKSIYNKKQEKEKSRDDMEPQMPQKKRRGR